MRLKLDQLEATLDRLLKEIDSVKEDEIKAHLSRYFCIRVSGYLENVVKALTISYCENSSSRPISNYLDKELKNLTNLSEEKLLKFLQKFSTDWEHNFASKFTEKQRASLNSIISNRNNIAHGQQDSISYKAMQDYYIDIKEIVQLLKKVIKK